MDKFSKIQKYFFQKEQMHCESNTFLTSPHFSNELRLHQSWKLILFVKKPARNTIFKRNQTRNTKQIIKLTTLDMNQKVSLLVKLLVSCVQNFLNFWHNAQEHFISRIILTWTPWVLDNRNTPNITLLYYPTAVITYNLHVVQNIGSKCGISIPNKIATRDLGSTFQHKLQVLLKTVVHQKYIKQ